MVMRNAFLLSALACAGIGAQAQAADVCAARSAANTVPLVELYTSEGCSSCPPADRWLSQHYADGEANFLAFHVDYWDSIGWPDRFGSPANSRRQRSRVAATGGSTVYTPQVMVGRDVRASWHSNGALRQVSQEARQPAQAALALRLRRVGDGWQAALGAAPADKAGNAGEGAVGADAQIWLARYIDEQTTAVRAGENTGVNLHHDRVVRELFGPWKFGNDPVSQRVDLPAETSPWGVTAFVQDSQGNVLQSLDLKAAACQQSASLQSQAVRSQAGLQ